MGVKTTYELVAEKIIDQLSKGTAPWQRSWKDRELPYNAISGKSYKGFNSLTLISSDFKDPRWLTYKQAKDIGGQVRLGEKGLPITYYIYEELKTVYNKNGKPKLDENGKEIKALVKYERPKLVSYTVFNAEQIDGMPPLEIKQRNNNEIIENAEKILANSGAEIINRPQNGAFYKPAVDKIYMPERSQFNTIADYYGTALHELGHWSGHPTRLNRDLTGKFGSESYAKEELRAEIASMMLEMELGIPHDVQQHASYVGSWIKVLKDDPREIQNAAKDAEKIKDYIVGLAQKQELAQEQTIEQEQIVQDIPLNSREFEVIAIKYRLPQTVRVNNDGSTRLTETYETGEISNVKELVDAIKSKKFNRIECQVLGKTKDGEQIIFSEVVTPDDCFASLDHSPNQSINKICVDELENRITQQINTINGTSIDDPFKDLVVRPISRNKSDLSLHGVALRGVEAYKFLDKLAQQYQKYSLALDFRFNIQYKNGYYALRADKLFNNLESNLNVGDILAKNLSNVSHNIDLVNKLTADFKTQENIYLNNLKQNPQAYDLNLSDIKFTVKGEKFITSGKAKSLDDLQTKLRNKFSQTGDPITEENSKYFEFQPSYKDKFIGDSIVFNEYLNKRHVLLEINAKNSQGYQVPLNFKFIFSQFKRGDALLPDLKQKLGRELSYYHVNTPELIQHSQTTNQNEVEQTSQQITKEAEVEKAIIIPVGMKKIYIDVPYKEKDEAKALGAMWDRAKGSWFITDDLDQSKFGKWQVLEKTQPKLDNQTQNQLRTYLAVPYTEKEEAKALGAKWDKKASSWYVEGKPSQAFDKWLVENNPVQQDPSLSPREEFANFMKEMGLNATGEHPIMDGQIHRVSVNGDKSGELSGSYVLHGDGLPAGYVQNFKTGEKQNWKAKGYYLSQEDKARMQAETAQKLQDREQSLIKKHEAVSNKLTSLNSQLEQITEHSYLAKKGIQPHLGVYQDKYGNMVIPAYDENGKIWTNQTINQNGEKRFTLNGKKDGNFHVIDGIERLENAKSIIIAEGYATAVTIHEALNSPDVAVISAFDSGNLKAVATKLKDKFPDSNFIIAGDDDAHRSLENKPNVGRTKAIEASEAIKANVIFPTFPQDFANQKACTDFNDLLRVAGVNSVQRQIKGALLKLTTQQQQIQKQELEQTRSQLQETPKNEEKLEQKRRLDPHSHKLNHSR